MKLMRISQADNVCVALAPVRKGEYFSEFALVAAEDIPQGHKIALYGIRKGEAIRKYGFPIGKAVTDIAAGTWVHTHNCATCINTDADYTYEPDFPQVPRYHGELPTFDGYLREDGRAAVRNEIWILPTVGCVNDICTALAQKNRHLVSGSLEGIHAFPHPYGCSQLGEDHAHTRALLAGLTRHPNAGGVLIVGLGCENLTMDQFREELGQYDPKRVKFLICQEVEDEMEAGSRLLAELAAYAKTFSRQPLPCDKLVIGLKCGGSDGLSGITANPTVGAFSDLLIARGGTSILTEVPEMFGAETILMNRCIDRAVFDKTVAMIRAYKDYYTSHGEKVYENPSPGNKAGGITTLEDKSLGCVQKGGLSPVTDVIGYAEQATARGLNLLYGPGNDLVSSTALTAAGAHILLFTTGRGTPFGAPAPTIKIATNTLLFDRKRNWIDFNAGTVAECESIAQAGERLFAEVLSVASGKRTASERSDARSIAIFKDGVTL